MSFIRPKGQLTIPRAIRAALGLEEGDPVEIEIVDEGILLRPKKVINASQAWFWAPAWQEGEAHAARDIAEGRGDTLKTTEDLLASLDE